MGNWQQFSTGALEPLSDIGSSITQITNAISTAINIQKTALEILATLSTDTLNAEALIVKTVIETIENILNEYTNADAKLHMLVIPVRKQPPYNLQTDFQIPPEETSWNIDPSISDADRKKFYDTITRIATSNQGNKGFLRTLYEETLDDSDDVNHPTYDHESAVIGTAIVVGAQNITSIHNLIRVIQGIMGTSLQGNTLLPNTITKTPQNLTTKTTNEGVLLNWENPPTTQTLTDFDNARVRIDEIAIIRSEDDNIAIAKDWNALFGSKQPTILTEADNEKTNTLTSEDTKTKIILQTRYEGVRNSFVDTDTLEQNKDYYYTVAYRYVLANEPSSTGIVTWESQNYFQISNVVKIRLRKTLTKTTKGTQPNWVINNSPLDLIPDLKFFITALQNTITALKSQTTGTTTALNNYVNFLESESTRYSDFSTNTNAKLTQLTSLIEIPDVNIYTTTISLTQGGTYGFLQELTKRMTKETDTTAPPFWHRGFVAGLILLTGGETVSDFASTKALLELLFGEGTAKTAFESALDSIDTLLDTVESKLFGADMQPGTSPSATTVYKTFDDKMNPVSADDPTVSIPFNG